MYLLHLLTHELLAFSQFVCSTNMCHGRTKNVDKHVRMRIVFGHFRDEFQPFEKMLKRPNEFYLKTVLTSS